MGRSGRFLSVAALVAVAATTLVACSSSGTSSPNSTSSSGAVKTGGSITMALDENLAGFNINTTASEEYVLQEILDLVWPQPYIVNSSLQPALNTAFITSVKETLNPQTVTYNINQKAVWQDGTPIDADDFIYNWQAQSGNTAYTDVGGQPYDSASSVGYNQIASVTGSNPPAGQSCDPGSAADRNAGLCPNGKTVTVKFATPYADWQGLFTNIVPAHIARTVGWNTGFAGPAQTISGSWYEIQSYSANQSVVLVRNTRRRRGRVAHGRAAHRAGQGHDTGHGARRTQALRGARVATLRSETGRVEGARHRRQGRTRTAGALSPTSSPRCRYMDLERPVEATRTRS